MLNVKKTFALAIIALFIGLIAYSTASSITTNGTNFTFNISGQPAMDNFSTVVCGVNMTCSQNSTPDNHTIFINSLGAGGGGGSGTVTQINQGTGIILVPNPITTTGTAYLNGVSCNPANQASVLNSSGGLECVSNIDTGIGAEVDPFSVHWNVFANAVHNNESEAQFNANYSNIVNVTNNSYVLKNGTWGGQNTTIDTNFSFNGYGLKNISFIENLSSPITETYYYVAKNGSDNNDCLGLSSACLTIQKAVNKIPAILNNNYHIRVQGGIYLETIKIGGKAFSGSYKIYINGTILNLTSVVGKNVYGSNAQIENLINLNKTITQNQYAGKWLRFENGTMNGKKRVIDQNNLTALIIVGDWLTAGTTNSLITIYENNVTINHFTLEPNQVNIVFSNINVNNLGSTTTSGANTIVQAQAEFYEVYFIDAVDTSLSDLYCYMCVMNGTVDFSGFQARNSVHEYQASLIYNSCGNCAYDYSWGTIVKPGSYVLITSGTVFRNFTYGVYDALSGVTQLWGKTDSWPFYKSNDNALYSVQGGHISTTGGNVVFISNIKNMNVDFTSFSWIEGYNSPLIGSGLKPVCSNTTDLYRGSIDLVTGNCN